MLQEGWEVNIALLAASAALITILVLRTTVTSAAVQDNPAPYIFYVSDYEAYCTPPDSNHQARAFVVDRDSKYSVMSICLCIASLLTVSTLQEV